MWYRSARIYLALGAGEEPHEATRFHFAPWQPAAWPFSVLAQLPMPMIGFISARSPEDSVLPLEAFRRGLKEGGFVEGKNVAIEFRWARGDYSRLPALAADLVSREVNVIVAAGGEPSAVAAKTATATIPIVFGTAVIRSGPAWWRASTGRVAM